jgi:hypothetical protein
MWLGSIGPLAVHVVKINDELPGGDLGIPEVVSSFTTTIKETC